MTSLQSDPVLESILAQFFALRAAKSVCTKWPSSVYLSTLGQSTDSQEKSHDCKLKNRDFANSDTSGNVSDILTFMLPTLTYKMTTLTSAQCTVKVIPHKWPVMQQPDLISIPALKCTRCYFTHTQWGIGQLLKANTWLTKKRHLTTWLPIIFI